MTSDTSPYSQVPPPAPPPMAATRGWTGSDLAVGGALVVLLIALFLPWFSGTISPGSGVAVSGAGDGPTSHGYLWAVFVLAILGLIVLVARDAITRVPGNLPSSEQMLVGATGLALLLTILGVAFKPTFFTASSSALLHFTVSVGWSYGGFVALVAALTAFVAAFRAGGAQQTGRRMTMPSLRRGGTAEFRHDPGELCMS